MRFFEENGMNYSGADVIFPHLGIVIRTMHNHITLPGGFTIAFYGIIIGIGMLIALFVIFLLLFFLFSFSVPGLRTRRERRSPFPPSAGNKNRFCKNYSLTSVLFDGSIA